MKLLIVLLYEGAKPRREMKSPRWMTREGLSPVATYWRNRGDVYPTNNERVW